MDEKSASRSRLCRMGVLMFAVVASVTALAGALDREPMQQRYNPAAENMLRIPGVVGMYESDAVSTLQQSGLAVDVRYIRKVRKNHAGKEGLVVEQVPSAAGVAMLGTSVTITVYAPPGEASGPREDMGGHGDAEYDDVTAWPDVDRGGWRDDGGYGGGEDAATPDWGAADGGADRVPPPPFAPAGAPGDTLPPLPEVVPESTPVVPARRPGTVAGQPVPVNPAGGAITGPEVRRVPTPGQLQRARDASGKAAAGDGARVPAENLPPPPAW